MHFLVFIIAMCILGLPLYAYFEDCFGNTLKKTPLDVFVFSSYLGITTYTLTIMTFGQLGSVINKQSLLFCYACLLIILFLCLARNLRLLGKYFREDAFFSSPLEHIRLPLFILLLLLLVFAGLIIIVKSSYYPHWDHFTFWLIDAKMIFETDHLRGTNNILGPISYSSYWPLHAVYIYEMFNGIREQYASFFTVLYILFGTYFSYKTISDSTFWKQVLWLTGILFTIGAFYSLGTAVNFYAEALVAATISFLALVILKDPRNIDYHKRVLLISTICFILAIIKSANIYYSALVIFIWGINDLYYFHCNSTFKNLPYKKISLVTSCFFLVAITPYIYYSCFVLGTAEWLVLVNNIKAKDFVFISRLIHYTDDLIDYLVTSYTFIFAYITLLLVFAIRINKKSIVLLSFILLFPMLNIFDYIIHIKSFQSGSLLRYVSTIFFIIPMLARFVCIDTSLIKKITIVSFAIIAIKYITFFTPIWNWPDTSKFHNGKYSDFRVLKGCSDSASKIKNYIKNEPILVVNTWSGHKLGDVDKDSLQYRYFLYPNIITPPFRFHQEKDGFNMLSQMVKKNNIKYLLFLRPDITLASSKVCGNLKPCLVSIEADKLITHQYTGKE